MDLKRYFHTLTRKAATGLVFALAISLLTVSFAFAALHAIDTNNDSESDWASVPVFQTDGTGDLVDPACSSTYGDQDDIIETFVATGPSDPPTHIWFGVRTADQSAISDQYHQVAAYVDCGPSGSPPDGHDLMDMFVLYQAPADRVFYGDGHWPEAEDRPFPVFVVGYDPDGPEGERPLDALDRVEWGMPFSDLSALQDEEEFPYGNYGFDQYDPKCSPGSEARIKFFTYKVLPPFGEYDCAYDETDWAGFDIPTVVELNSLRAQATTGVDRLAISAAALLGAAAVGGLGFLLVHRRKQSA